MLVIFLLFLVVVEEVFVVLFWLSVAFIFEVGFVVEVIEFFVVVF